MGVIRGVASLFYSVLCLLTVVACLLCYWTITSHWLGGFLMIALPAFVIIHIVVMILAALTGNSIWMRSLLLLLLFYPLSSRLYTSNEITASEEAFGKSLKVISFNLMRFDEKKIFYSDSKVYEKEFKSWLKKENADVLFFQEYNNFKGGKKNKTWAWFEEQGYKYFAGNERDPHLMSGPVIFSKYPLINKDYIDFGTLNGLVSAQVIVEADTLTLVNVHLHSMTLKLGNLLKQETIEGTKNEGKVAVGKMKEGWSKRKLELLDIERTIDESPYPVVLCGDFNETPFSYVYSRISKVLDNAFEKKGDGFGFTYNQLPYFIRIDNQFFDGSALEVSSFQTITDVRFSDHNPIIGTYYRKR